MWEAALIARQFELSNLVAVIDHNKMQSLDTCDNTIRLSPFAVKWESFSWRTLEVDGHDHTELAEAFASLGNDNRPTVIIAHTVKGKGASFMEHDILWHYRDPQGADYQNALNELRAAKPSGLVDPYGKEGRA